MHAMMQTRMQKVEKFFVFFVTKLGLLQFSPPLQESRPEILGLSEEGGVFLTKTSFSLPCGFFLGMVRPLNL